jgi:hypothetical protein
MTDKNKNDALREAVLDLAARWELFDGVGSVDARGVCRFHAKQLREVVAATRIPENQPTPSERESS